jgi:transaldolase
MSAIRDLSQLGQSVWIDWLSRDLLESGGLKRLMSEHGVTGVTTNPRILERSISAGGYDDQVDALTEFGLAPRAVIEELAVTDITDAAVALLPVWEHSGGRDGYVSLEVDPTLAWDARQTVSDVRRLGRRIYLPNVLIKIPATEPGLLAIEESIASGHSINVTLIFSVERYAAVAESYLRGLRRAADAGLDLSTIHSVASIFVSRLDTSADALLDAQRSSLASARRGRLGIATGRLAYRHFRAVFEGRRWEALRSRGANPQRLLWASTSTKDARYRDVRYVEELIGPDTVTTLPKETLEAFLDHGHIAETLQQGAEHAMILFADLEALGVNTRQLAERLEEEGIADFRRARDAASRIAGARERALVA